MAFALRAQCRRGFPAGREFPLLGALPPFRLVFAVFLVSVRPMPKRNTDTALPDSALLLRPAQVAQLLGITVPALRRMDAELKPERTPGGHRRYSPSVIEKEVRA